MIWPSLKDMFEPMLGVITAVIATIAAVMTAVFGPFKKLRLPVESVPGISRGVLNMILFAPFLTAFLLIDVVSARRVLIASTIPLVLGFACYQKYGAQLQTHRFSKPRQQTFLWVRWIREETLIGGTVLTPAAAARQSQTNKTESTMLAEAEYKADEIWTRQSVSATQAVIERWYYGFMLCALLTVVMAALAAQTIISGRSPLATAQQVWAAFTASRT